ncbi:MAG: bifunctional adenosylcobinamide kinase/adenosylcobinamide-phosphate guanylyltransferase [Thermodesulfovibrionales bacterium]|nr:bifunctional adenosylcobinamide kinase/adenosylcobinamide-phosphate guanylyltransferase [Thermodesulfovibrionales bacterium]
MINQRNKIIFIIGGAKSGKSSIALKHASSHLGKKAYIATAEPLDSEMFERIQIHKKQRDSGWEVFEEPLLISNTVNSVKGKYASIILDCLTLWISNLLTKQDDRGFVEQEMQNFINAINNFKNGYGCQLVIVSNEVGMGIVPDNSLARLFRDIAGSINQQVAEVADEVYLAVSGIPLKIKG